MFDEVPHVMTAEEVQELVRGYGESAANVQQAGYDGVEIHSAHGYLPQQFIDPSVNDRTDQYGGSLENRARFLVEVLQEIRDRCGSSFGLGVQLNAYDGTASGLNPDLAGEVVEYVRGLGFLDYATLGIGGKLGGDPSTTQSPDMSFPEAPYVDIVAPLRARAQGLPIGHSGRITKPEAAQSAIERGKLDYVGIGRAMFSDPEWVNKARTGRRQEIRPCIGANQCWQGTQLFTPPTCIHNPSLGHEGRYGAEQLNPAGTPLRVLVIGGGPGGMEAATWAARRGHKVALAEASDGLGGQTRMAALAPHRTQFGELTAYQIDRLQAAEVEVRLNDRVEAGDSWLAEYDVVIVATGSTLRPSTLESDGSATLIDLWSPIRRPEDLPESVAILDPGGAGWEIGATAQFLAHLGKRVTAVSAAAAYCSNVPVPDWPRFGQLNRVLGIEVFTGAGELRLDGGRADRAPSRRGVVVGSGRVRDLLCRNGRRRRPLPHAAARPPSGHRGGRLRGAAVGDAGDPGGIPGRLRALIGWLPERGLPTGRPREKSLAHCDNGNRDRKMAPRRRGPCPPFPCLPAGRAASPTGKSPDRAVRSRCAPLVVRDFSLRSK